MKIIIHADPGEAGLAAANRVRDKIVRRVAAAEGITEVVPVPMIQMEDIAGKVTEYPREPAGYYDPNAVAWAGGGRE